MTLYNTDVYAWSQEQAPLLDGRQWERGKPGTLAQSLCLGGFTPDNCSQEDISI